MDSEHEISELKHRLLAMESNANALSRTVAEDCRSRDASDARMAESMSLVADRLDTIVTVLTGNIKTPDVPGLIHKMTVMQAQHQSGTVATADVKAALQALQKSLEDYRASMPTAVDLKAMQDTTATHQSRVTYVMGWLGGVAAVLLVVYQVVAWLVKFSSK